VKNSAQSQSSQPHSHAVIWLDHLTARIFKMGLTGITPSVVHAHLESSHLHHKANTIGSGKVEGDPKFLAEIGAAIDNCNDVLILGPGIEKTALARYLQSTRPDTKLRLEPSDHPTDEEIVAIGRKQFGLVRPRA
jgi:stalled ribosome rescue protein Dom34